MAGLAILLLYCGNALPVVGGFVSLAAGAILLNEAQSPETENCTI